MPSWLISCGDFPVRTVPSNTTAPLVGGMRPMMTLSSVDLPAPFGPMMAWVFPSSIWRSISERARRPPKFFCTSAAWSTMLGVACDMVLLRRLSGEGFFGRSAAPPVHPVEQSVPAFDDSARQEDDDQHEHQAKRQMPAFANKLRQHGDKEALHSVRKEREEVIEHVDVYGRENILEILDQPGADNRAEQSARAAQN